MLKCDSMSHDLFTLLVTSFILPLLPNLFPHYLQYIYLQVGSFATQFLSPICSTINNCMCPEPGRREQRATRSRAYVWRASSRWPAELQGPGDNQPLHLAHSWEWVIPLFSGELRNFLLVDLGGLDWSSRERELVWTPGGELGLYLQSTWG